SSGMRYFFFQAEDGIRDFHVTGVQTCALPISSGEPVAVFRGSPEGVDVAQVEAGIHPLGEQVHGESDDVDVAGALTVAEQGSLEIGRASCRERGEICGAGVTIQIKDRRDAVLV